ncbi:MAG: ABC transporter permease [Rhodobacteraceae bacterium]|nr:ABC transporter permease [Paracoccaceae bacterium]
MTERDRAAPGDGLAPASTALPGGAGPLETLAGPPRSQWLNVWDRFRRHKGAMTGAAIFALVVLAVFAGPLLWPPDATLIDIRARNTRALTACFSEGEPWGWEGPAAAMSRFFAHIGAVAQCFANPETASARISWAHPLGTDQLGRDILARMLMGGRISVSVGIAAMLLALGLGSAIGVVAGFFRRLDGPLMRLTDLFLALPLLPLLLVMMLLFREPLSGAFGPERGIFILIVCAIGVTSWMPTARIVRADVLALKEREFMLAARSIGTSDSRMITRHILPNVLSPIMVSATLGIATAIITESALSFLGLGFPPDFPTWGRLLFDATDYLQQYPERVIWPGLAISLTVLSVNYLGDGLRDALDPRGGGR